MRKNLIAILLALVYCLAASTEPGFATAQTVLGKWILHVETPNGQIEAELELKLEGERLTGSAFLFNSTVPLASASFAEEKLLVELNLGAAAYRLAGLMQEGRLHGVWEQLGGEVSGTWSGTRRMLPTPNPAAGSVGGTWDSVASTPQGDLPFLALLKQEGESVSGSLGASDGSFSAPIRNVMFSDETLTFEVDYLGGTYRIRAKLIQGKLIGAWESVDGSISGAWSATRRTP